VLGEMLSSKQRTSLVDIRSLVKHCASEGVVKKLPMLETFGLQHGAQVLIDAGEGMTPFLRDAEDVARRIRLLVGTERSSELRFLGTPLQVCRVPGSLKTIAYAPPQRGAAVIALTDLGIGQVASVYRASPGDWVRFAAMLEEVGCAFVALVPYPSSRYPGGLPRSLHIVQWDERTGIRRVRRAF
jgi:hypothetical protein